jgi:predicted ABC-type ATPase
MNARRKSELAGAKADFLRELDKVLSASPIIVALAGPNGAGKTTFYHTHLKPAGIRFLNADDISRELEIDAYEAAEIVRQLRRELVKQRENFVFETADPVDDKVGFLKEAAHSGYSVVLCFIGVSSPEMSEQRVAMRVSQGGHDVPSEKLISRFPRTMTNLQTAIRDLPHVLIFDNDDLHCPFRPIAMFLRGKEVWSSTPIPRWLKKLMQA